MHKTKQAFKKVKWLFGKEIKIPKNWTIKRLSELSNNKDDIVAGPFGSNLKVSDYQDDGVPIIRLQNIERNIFVNKNIKFINKLKAEELAYHSYLPGDLVLAKLGEPIGKTCDIPSYFPSGIVVADVVRIRVSSKKADHDFVIYILNSNMCAKQYNKEKIGTTRPRVNLNQIRDLQFPVPPLNEQKKIASILSRVDALIESTQKVIGKTKRLKKDLMQQLLARGVNHTKFKKIMWLFGERVSIPNNWDVTKFRSKIKMEYGFSLREDKRDAIGKPVYGSGGIIGLHSRPAMQGPGVIVSRKGSLGNTFYEFGSFFPIDTVYFITKKETSLDLKFLFYYIKNMKLENHAIVTSKPGISRSEIYSLPIMIPPHREQQKIASILSGVDAVYSLFSYTKTRTMQIIFLRLWRVTTS